MPCRIVVTPLLQVVERKWNERLRGHGHRKVQGGGDNVEGQTEKKRLKVPEIVWEYNNLGVDTARHIEQRVANLHL